MECGHCTLYSIPANHGKSLCEELQLGFPPRGRPPVSMAQASVNSKVQPGKVVVFIKPTCPYCSKTQELLRQFPFKEGLLECVDISATSDTNVIQACLQHLMGARMVPRVFIGKECIGACTDLVSMHKRGEILTRLEQIGALK